MVKLSAHAEAVAIAEKKLALKAADSLIAFAKYIDIPGVPVTQDDDCEDFYPDKVVPAAHHRLILSALQEIESGKIKRLMLFLPPGSAKALALDTPIPTPDGWKNMGDLAIGDRVFDEMGNPCNVTWVSPVWKDRPVFRVTTDCGDEIIADQDHEWLVCLDRKARLPLKNNGLGAPAKPDRDDLKSKTFIKTTGYLARRRSKRPMIFRAMSLNLPERDLPIDPFLLGCWLGDGDSSNIAITLSVNDQSWVRSELAQRGFETRDRSVDTKFGIPGQRAKFVLLGLLNDPFHKTFGKKHIPDIYMRSSATQRLSLLQGLIDTDGTVCKMRGCTTFSNTNRALAEQVRELVRSLGVKAGWSEGRAMLYGKDCGPYYRVGFYLKDAARLPRKAELTRNQDRTPNTYIDVQPAGIADTVCIEVDSPSHLFLCGRSMTPTHNSSYASVLFPPWYIGRNPKHSIIATSYGSDLAKKFGRKCRSIVRSQEYQNVFNTTLSGDNSAVDDWSLTNGSQYMSGGILSGITGNRAHGLLIDDPVKGREDADSEVIREKTWEAYLSDLRSRLAGSNGWICLIQTRWSEDDLAGRILPENYEGQSGWVTARDGEPWYVINMPACCEREDDLLGRKPGEWLWPDWFTPEHWEQERRSQGPRNWSALFQQRPAPEEGDYFKREWFRYYTTAPDLNTLRIYGASDYAVTEDGGDWTVHGVVGVDPDDNIYVLDIWRQRTSPDVWIEAFLDLCDTYKPEEWGEEAGQIKRSVGPFIKKRQMERKIWTYRRQYPSSTNKSIRAQSIRGRAAMNKIYLPRNAPWMEPFLNELLVFPSGRYDDQVDFLSLIGRMLDHMMPGMAPRVPEARIPENTITLNDLWKAEDKKRARGYI